MPVGRSRRVLKDGIYAVKEGPYLVSGRQVLHCSKEIIHVDIAILEWQGGRALLSRKRGLWGIELLRLVGEGLDGGLQGMGGGKLTPWMYVGLLSLHWSL
jgi:hypothetical protein